LVDLIYNAALLAVDIGSIRMARPYGLERVTIAVAAFGIGAAGLAIVLGGGPFGVMRLACYAIFVHASALSALAFLQAWKSSRRLAVGLLAVTSSLVLVALDAFVIEPQHLAVSHVRLASSRAPRALTIAVLADVQTDHVGVYERDAFAAVVKEKPDLVLFAGDYVQVAKPELHPEREALRAAMRDVGLAAPLGVYAVRGNVDPNGWEEIFEGVSTTFERTRAVDAGDVRVTGLGVDDSFDPTLRISAADRFHIVLGHAPNFALGDVQADLLVAGHTHGGQVRLPWVGPLVTFSAIPRRWAEGATPLSGGRWLVVSRGVGLERGQAPRLRFLCRPEIVVIHVDPSAN
jgi:predicted MPP superfamily phosphohydrolase